MSTSSEVKDQVGIVDDRETIIEVYARADSLPLSLRHINSDSAMQDAKNLTKFIRHTVELFADDQSEIEGESLQGLALVVCLLTDKLDIASGDYKFPFVGWSGDVLTLAERE